MQNKILQISQAAQRCPQRIARNDHAVQLLRCIQPQWIDDLPMLASATEKPRGVVCRCAWLEAQQVAVSVTYFGKGFQPADTGWILMFHHCLDKADFDRITATARAIAMIAELH